MDHPIMLPRSPLRLAPHGRTALFYPASRAASQPIGQRVHSVPITSFAFAAVLSAPALCRGFDSQAGMAISFLLNGALLTALTLVCPPTPLAARQIRPAVVLVACAIGWAMLATWVGNGRWTEFATPRLLSLCSGFAALLCGLLFGVANERRGITRLLDLILGFNCILLLLGLAFRYSDTAEGMLDYWTLSRLGRFTGTIGNSNVTAALSGSLCLYAFWRFIATTNRRTAGRERGLDAIRAPLYGLAAFLTLGTIVATASRFSIVVLALLMAVIALGRRQRLARLLFRPSLPNLILTGVLAMLVAFLIADYGDMLGARFGRLLPELDYRAELWRHYGQIAAESPWLGYGLGSFQSVNAHFLSSPRFAEKAFAINSPHDLPLQLLLVGGWPYLFLLVAAAICIVKSILRTMRNSDHRIFGAMIAMLLATSLVDIVLDMPVTVSLAMALTGLLWGQSLKIDVAGSRAQP
ncbi:hypothetical protein BH10PSE13_BH10PSE13_04550 [soil metagenome]